MVGFGTAGWAFSIGYRSRVSKTRMWAAHPGPVLTCLVPVFALLLKPSKPSLLLVSASTFPFYPPPFTRGRQHTSHKRVVSSWDFESATSNGLLAVPGILGFWVRLESPDFVLVGDSKFRSFDLVWYRPHLPVLSCCFNWAARPRLLFSVFLTIYGSLLYHRVLFGFFIGRTKAVCNSGWERKAAPSFSIQGVRDCPLLLCIYLFIYLLIYLFSIYTSTGLCCIYVYWICKLFPWGQSWVATAFVKSVSCDWYWSPFYPSTPQMYRMYSVENVTAILRLTTPIALNHWNILKLWYNRPFPTHTGSNWHFCLIVQFVTDAISPHLHH